jgi:microcystin synthetase protein McyD
MENQNQSTYKTVLSTEQSIVSDHKFQKDYVVPAAVYFAMVKEAFMVNASSKELEFLEVTILNALIVEQDEPVNVFVLLEKDGTVYRFKVVSQKQDKNSLHVFGKVRESSFQREDSLLLTEIKARCQKYMGKQEFYERYERSGIFYGQYYKTVQEVHPNHFEFLSVIESEGIYDKSPLHPFSIFPAYMDGVIQSIGSIYRGDEKIIYVPGFIKKVGILKLPAGKCYCYGTTYTDSSKNPEKLLYDLIVCDEKGLVVMELLQFEMKRYETPSHR